MISVWPMVYVVPRSTWIHCGQGEAAQRVVVLPSTAWEASLPVCWLENVTGLFKARLVAWAADFAIAGCVCKPSPNIPAIRVITMEICTKNLVKVFMFSF